MENFRDMSDKFLSARAAVQVSSGPQLGQVWVQMIQDKPLVDRMGKSARELCERNRGATSRALDRIAELLPGTEYLA
jgi:3-deoxy-D-manno-octulosonic-acid transferase